MEAVGRWRVWIDTGGTFTDAVGLDPEGRAHALKILSSASLRARIRRVEAEGTLLLDVAPPHGIFDDARLALESGQSWAVRSQRGARIELEGSSRLEVGAAVTLRSPFDAPLLAAHWLSATASGESLPAMDLRVATTRGTNALLERRGARCAMLLSHGLEDILRIRTQQRPELFARVVRRAPPFASRFVGVRGRLDAQGKLVEEFDGDTLSHELEALRAEGIESVGIAFVHSYLDPRLEERAEALSREAGFSHISRSSDLASEQGYLNRATSCEINAYLQPILSNYLEGLRDALPEESTLSIMRSSGTLLPAARFEPVDGLLSGPAGGAMGAALVAEELGIAQALCFDMGGTSTDVARVADGIQRSYSHQVGDAQLLTEAVDLETVAAGGGSICHVEHGLPKVGPRSAGATPGPACYGAGGPLAITDANVLLGRIRPTRFPFALDLDAARRRLGECIAQMAEAPPDAQEELLAGFLQLANERMAAAIRRMSVKRGHDPAQHALIAFGGAGGQHACAVAALLGIRTVVFPEDASLLSAIGVGNARSSHMAQCPMLRRLEDCTSELAHRISQLDAEAIETLRSDGVKNATIERRVAELRFEGQESCLAVSFDKPEEISASFREAYEQIYNHSPGGRAIELVSLRSHAVGADSWRAPRHHPVEERGTQTTTRLHDGSGWIDAAVYERHSLEKGATIRGPLLIEEEHSVLYVPADWTIRAHETGAIVAEGGAAMAETHDSSPTALSMELFQHRFEAIARSMGERLRRTAVSTNVKEREDFSCAILDPDGSLVVNAPHIPVHLGALGSCLRTVRREFELGPKDVILTNHPAFGGSHLPDLTLLAAVHAPDGGLMGYVASRAHHAEIGGVSPGSMPARATRLVEEAVVIPPIHVVRGGKTDLTSLERLLRDSAYPSRTPEDNLADTQAMIAACHAGIEELIALSERCGSDVLLRHMEALRSQAAMQMRVILSKLPVGVHRSEERLDDGSVLAVAITIDPNGEKVARFDFGGTSPENPGNLNATEAVVRSCVLYVLRVLVGEDLPFNEGLLDPVEIEIPRGMLSPDFSRALDDCPAVVGGNVETSQRLVDCMLRALELSAASHGSMNNLSFGNDAFGYYETLGGGCGAQAEAAGESAIHTHMTNTRITDVEVLEHRYPVRVLEFSIRDGSGGGGKMPGGEGLRRELLFLEDVKLSLLTQRRTAGAPGMHGGESGAPGVQYVERADGTRRALAPQDEYPISAGDRLIMMTPGGGGWGKK